LLFNRSEPIDGVGKAIHQASKITRLMLYCTRQRHDFYYILSIMMNEIYNRKILELAAHIPLVGRLENPMGTATRHSKLCGSMVTVDVDMEGGLVSKFAHEIKACALGQAASSIMARHVIGATGDELRALLSQVKSMLKEQGPPPQAPWDDVAVLEPVRDYKARHASTLLTFEAVVEAVDKIEQSAKPA
jgi:NifU-like protein involved in Fe-S cluster formation